MCEYPNYSVDRTCYVIELAMRFFGDKIQHCHRLNNPWSCLWYKVWSHLKAHWQYEPAMSYVLWSTAVLQNIKV